MVFNKSPLIDATFAPSWLLQPSFFILTYTFQFLSLQEEFLRSRIKVNGKTNNFGNHVGLERAKSKITLTSDISFSKRSVQHFLLSLPVLTIFQSQIIFYYKSWNIQH